MICYVQWTQKCMYVFPTKLKNKNKSSRILLNLQTYKMKLVKDRIRNPHFLANVHDLVRFF